MIIFPFGEVAVAGVSKRDAEAMHPYLSYSKYILNRLGDVPEDVADIVTTLDLGIRNYTGRISMMGTRNLTALLTKTHRTEIGVTGTASMPFDVRVAYGAVVALGPGVRAKLSRAGVTPDKLIQLLRTFDRRLPVRPETVGPMDGASLFVSFLTGLIHPTEPPLLTATDVVMRQILDWKEFFPQLFVVRKDRAVFRSSVDQLVQTIAAGRGTSTTTVRKVLGLR